MSLLVSYSLFAFIAIAVNILFQEFALLFYRGSYELAFAIPTGTAAGLIIKYVLDRKYIFNAATRPLHLEGRQFLAYTVTGAFTTLLFWGSEIAFDRAFGTLQARYFGAVLGLGCGYALKYHLDRRYVFTSGE
jgi:putative flippase GtrA